MNLTETLKMLRNRGIEPTAVSYARFSSDNQREESIEAQQRALNEFAQAYNIDIIHEYADRAKSATSDAREEFQKMIEDSNKHEFRFVIVHKLDRFSRNRADMIGYRIKLRNNGVQLISVIEQYDPESPEGALMEGMIEAMSEFYSRNLSREVKKGLKENALRAKSNGGIPPLGYDIDPETKKYVINKEEAAAVRLIFEMTQNHYPYQEIIDRLHANGYRTKIGNYFQRNSLYEILRNPRYAGTYVYFRVASADYITKTRNNHLYNPEPIIVPNGIPAIITQKLFDNVQKILDNRKNKHAKTYKENYLLSGLIRCGECGSAYAGNRTVLRSGKLNITYRCDSRKNKVGRTCDNGAINRDYIEGSVIEYIQSIIFHKDLFPSLLARYNTALAAANATVTQQIRDLSTRIAGIEKAINNILLALENCTSHALISHLTELEKQKNTLEQRRREITEQNAITPISESHLKSLIDKAKALMKQDGFPSRRRIVETFIEKVLVFKNRAEIILNAAPFVTKGDYTKYHKIIPKKA